MRINWNYISFLVFVIGLYFVLLFFMPQKFNWFITLYHKDKDPFGTYVLKSLIDEAWLTEINTSNQTLFELKDREESNLLILCEQFQVSESEIESLLAEVSDGKNAIIAAHHIDTVFADSLGFRLNELSFSFYLDQLWGKDSLGLRFIDDPFDTTSTYWLPTQLAPQYFESFDSASTEVIAKNTDEKPVLINIRLGAGNLLISSTPLVFTNFSLLKERNHEFVAGIFSFFPAGALQWTEYYQLGRLEAQTPLRYVLSEPSLKWALYILMITIIIVMIFEIKRKQRIIPVIVPLKNETLDFVKTIARLYYQKKDHKDLALKKILHFTDYLKQRLYIDITDDVSIVITKVAAKLGVEESLVKLLFEQMNHISSASYISASELKLLMDRIDGVVGE